MSVAWCWASGLIEMGEAMPADQADGSGAILIARGPRERLQSRLAALARRGQGASAGRLLVPGVPEARSPGEALDALMTWLAWAARAPDLQGVVFLTAGQA